MSARTSVVAAVMAGILVILVTAMVVPSQRQTTTAKLPRPPDPASAGEASGGTLSNVSRPLPSQPRAASPFRVIEADADEPTAPVSTSLVLPEKTPVPPERPKTKAKRSGTPDDSPTPDRERPRRLGGQPLTGIIEPVRPQLDGSLEGVIAKPVESERSPKPTAVVRPSSVVATGIIDDAEGTVALLTVNGQDVIAPVGKRLSNGMRVRRIRGNMIYLEAKGKVLRLKVGD
jgi:hypothetical protein